MTAQDVSAHTLQNSCLAVLDTQAVLDWLHFNDPATQHWERWRQRGLWHWVASAPMREELAHVLGRGGLPASRGLTAGPLLACFDERAALLAQPAPSLAAGLRCSDPDDQKFIDLAVAHRACWLVSRDRAVLKLGRRALAGHSLRVVAPAAWAPGPPPAVG